MTHFNRSTFTASFRRVAVAGLFATTLVGSTFGAAQAAPCYFGECGSSAPAPTPAPTRVSNDSSDDFRVLGRHGNWTALTDGSTSMIMTRFDDGAKFAIIDKGNELGLIWSYDGWNYREGASFDIKIVVDGEVFNGTIVATSSNTLVAKGVKKEFIRTLYNGRQAKITFAKDTFTINSLRDAAAAIDDAVAFQRTSSR